MALQCNIDSRGKLARLIWGLALAGLGAVLIWLWAMPTHSVPSWIVSIACMMAGFFAIFEARAGWCAVRALGFKTPM
jgi:hypothetical protein